MEETGAIIKTLTAPLHITASCIIRKNALIKNESILWKDEEANEPLAFLVNAYHYLNPAYPKFFKMDNLSKLGWLAAEILLKDSSLQHNYKPDETSIVFANASASLDTDVRYFDTIKDIASPALFVYTLPNIVIGEICIRNGLKGENAFFVFEKFEVLFLQQYVETMMQQNSNKACIFGWVEVMANDYEAALFLVEKKSNASSKTFTADNIYKLYS